MLFTFEIEPKDFLTFQLYTISQSPNVLRTRRRGRLLTSVAGLLLSLNLFVTGSFIPALFMLVTAVISYAFYPKYHRWRLKSHFIKYSKKNYASQFGKEESLETFKDYILSKNVSGEGKVKMDELDRLTEIADHFFLKMRTGSSLILPKRFIQNDSELIKEMKRLNVPLHQELNWEY